MTGHLDTFEARRNSSLIAPGAVCYDTENGVSVSQFSVAFAATGAIVATGALTAGVLIAG